MRANDPTTPIFGFEDGSMQHHVGIVTAVGPDYVVLVSGNHGHKVGVGRYASNKIIAYRMAA